ncbi:MAG: hypothetical protein ACYDCN_03650 [Bacteroidia bacterium]
MKIKNTNPLSVFVALSIFFKLFFCSFLTVASNPLATNYPCFQQVKENIKVGTKRRRTICYLSHVEENSITEEQPFAENTERENSNELLKRFKLPFLSFFIDGLAHKIQHSAFIIHSFLNPPNSISTKKHLSLSILRI